MLHTMRQRMKDEGGFTLIELLVVILIIGILAAIAIPSFISQKDKAGDAAAKSFVRNMQTAEETYVTDNPTYAPNILALQTIEPSLNNIPSGGSAAVAAGATATTFSISATAKSGVVYTISRAATGAVTRSCAPVKAGCPAGGLW